MQCSVHDSNSSSRLWSFEGGRLTNKKSGYGKYHCVNRNDIMYKVSHIQQQCILVLVSETAARCNLRLFILLWIGAFKSDKTIVQKKHKTSKQSQEITLG